MTVQRILIIGGGFIGRALARTLHRRNHYVTVLSPSLETIERPGEPILVRGRQEDDGLVSALLQDHTTVIHSAWGTTPGSSAGRPVLENTAALAPWLTFLETLQRFPSMRLLFLSSGGTVYGNPPRLPVEESSSLQPLSCHGASKVAAELFLQTLRPASAAQPIIVRPSNVYGPGQVLRSGFGVLRHMLQCAIENKPFTLWGDGSQVRDYLYIEDFADAMAQLVEHLDVSGTFNVGNGSGVSIGELTNLVEKVTGHPLLIESRASRHADVYRIVLDINKIRQATGWVPHTELREGIAKTWHWLRTKA